MANEDEKREHQRQGKIARLPESLRSLVNQRILDGWTGKRICEWLNGLPEVQALLAAEFGGEPISDANLSRWRKGGYQDWLGDRERVVKIRSLAEYCGAVAQAGGKRLFAGASDILGGIILEALESAEAEDALGMAKAVVALRANEIQATKLDLEVVKSEQAERALQLTQAKFERETGKLFLRWRDNEKAKAIADGPGDEESKLKALAELFWADAPEHVGPGKKAEKLKAETLKEEPLEAETLKAEPLP